VEIELSDLANKPASLSAKNKALEIKKQHLMVKWTFEGAITCFHIS